MHEAGILQDVGCIGLRVEAKSLRCTLREIADQNFGKLRRSESASCEPPQIVSARAELLQGCISSVRLIPGNLDRYLSEIAVESPQLEAQSETILCELSINMRLVLSSHPDLGRMPK